MIAEHGRVQRKARKHHDEQADACETQSRMRHAMEEPAERRTFHRPANSDPLAVELDRENERDEKQRRAAEKRSEEHTSELQSRLHLVCRLLLEKKKKKAKNHLNRKKKK